jgi:hypothetical protein
MVWWVSDYPIYLEVWWVSDYPIYLEVWWVSDYPIYLEGTPYIRQEVEESRNISPGTHQARGGICLVQESIEAVISNCS